jgi:hypothetical protein
MRIRQRFHHSLPRVVDQLPRPRKPLSWPPRLPPLHRPPQPLPPNSLHSHLANGMLASSVHIKISMLD